jgi:hypothetical protein
MKSKTRIIERDATELRNKRIDWLAHTFEEVRRGAGFLTDRFGKRVGLTDADIVLFMADYLDDTLHKHGALKRYIMRQM